METKTPPHDLTEAEIAFVEALGRVLLVMPRLMDSALLKSQRLSMSEFMTMLTISRQSNQHIRMTELAAANHLSLSGMTRIVNRLEAEGWVERVKCAEDARGSNAVLTDAGVERLHQAMPSHVAHLRQFIFDHLDPSDLRKLTGALNAIAPSAKDDRFPCVQENRTMCGPS